MHDLAKTHKQISLIRVNNEKELRRYNVDMLARQLFGEDAERHFPIYIVFHKGRVCGFLHAVEQLVVYPAIHPEMMSPHEFVEVSCSLITELKRMAGNPLFMLCDKGPRATERLLKLVRLKKAKETAFIYREEGT